MTAEPFQQVTLFDDPVGLRLKHAREKERWSKEAVAQQLKIPTAVIDAIEREDWARLGAPIFVRSYIGSYAKLLGLPANLADEAVRDRSAPPLVAVGNSAPSQRMFDRGLMSLVYLLLTVVIAGAAIALAMYYQSGTTKPGAGPAATQARQPLAVQRAKPTPAAAVTDSASVPISEMIAQPIAMQPEASATTPDEHELRLYFRGESWLDAISRDGAHLERGMVPAGTERRYRLDQISRIVLGDGSQVEVSQGAAKLSLAAFRDASDPKIVRFAVSSSGTLVAVGP